MSSVDFIKNKYLNNIIYERRQSILNEADKYYQNGDNYTITKRYGVVGSNGVYNCCIFVDGFNHPMRARSEVIIFRDGKIYVNKIDSVDPTDSKFPGGGWNENEDPVNAAIRECKEEVRMNVKNILYAGSHIQYSDKESDVAEWVKENISRKYWWYGYYTKTYVADYDSEYKGKIAEIDKDEMINTIKLLDISKCYNKLPIYHRKAIDTYLAAHGLKNNYKI